MSKSFTKKQKKSLKAWYLGENLKSCQYVMLGVGDLFKSESKSRIVCYEDIASIFRDENIGALMVKVLKKVGVATPTSGPIKGCGLCLNQSNKKYNHINALLREIIKTKKELKEEIDSRSRSIRFIKSPSGLCLVPVWINGYTEENYTILAYVFSFLNKKIAVRFYRIFSCNFIANYRNNLKEYYRQKEIEKEEEQKRRMAAKIEIQNIGFGCL